MTHRFVSPTALSILPLVLLNACTPTRRPAEGDAEQIEEIRQIESERLRSLVTADLPTARRFHADDFQLVNPAGGPL